jgi:hypothetical protein
LRECACRRSSTGEQEVACDPDTKAEKNGTGFRIPDRTSLPAAQSAARAFK